MTTILLRRGTTAQWAADNPVLALGEPGYITDTGVVKVGDGVSTWSNLPPIESGVARLSGAYPLSAYGFVAATEAPTVCSQTSTLIHGFYARCFVPADTAITGVAAMVGTAGTLNLGGRNGYAIWDAVGTFLQSTVDDNTMWTTTGWIQKAWPTPIAAAANDRYMIVACGSEGYTTPPNIAYARTAATAIAAGGGHNATVNRRSFADTATTWPANINPLSYGSDPGGYIPLICLY